MESYKMKIQVILEPPPKKEIGNPNSQIVINTKINLNTSSINNRLNVRGILEGKREDKEEPKFTHQKTNGLQHPRKVSHDKRTNLQCEIQPVEFEQGTNKQLRINKL